MIIKVAIVEDNLEDQALMSGILEQWSRIRTEGVCKIRKDYYETGENFLAEVRKFQLKYHLIFMDIGLGGTLSGLETAQLLREGGDQTPLVFLTGYDMHMRQGYQVRALDYISKPAQVQAVYSCLGRLASIYLEAGYMISDHKGVVEIPYRDILYFSQEKHYMNIVTRNQLWKQRISIKDLERILPAQFVRCNRGSIINVFAVQQINKKFVLMKDGRSVPITAPYLEDVYSRYRNKSMIQY